MTIQALVAMAALAAGVFPGRWEKVAGLQPGHSMIVTLRGGERIECAFESLGEESLTVREDGARARMLPKREVRRITSADRHDDRVIDGVLGGTLAGLGGGFAAGAAIYYGQGGEKPEAAAFIVPVALFGSGVGALTGYLADRAHRAREVLYEARR